MCEPHWLSKELTFSVSWEVRSDIFGKVGGCWMNIKIDSKISEIKCTNTTQFHIIYSNKRILEMGILVKFDFVITD
jgi:hypothetical protein